MDRRGKLEPELVRCRLCGHEWRTRSIAPSTCPGCRKSCIKSGVTWVSREKAK